MVLRLKKLTRLLRGNEGCNLTQRVELRLRLLNRLNSWQRTKQILIWVVTSHWMIVVIGYIIKHKVLAIKDGTGSKACKWLSHYIGLEESHFILLRGERITHQIIFRNHRTK
jgi:hypothetical protein